MKIRMCFLLLFTYLSYCNGFYMPGVVPNEFVKGNPVEVKAVKITSSVTQLTYDYYSLNFCKPITGTVYKTENLGEILRGDRIVNTPYEIFMDQAVSCKLLCNSKKTPMIWSEKESNHAIDMIKHDYYVHLIVDNLPCATTFDHLETGTSVYERGYRLGYIADGDVFIYNHLKFILSYHSEDRLHMKIVQFEVEPKSVALGVLNNDDKSCSLPTLPPKSFTAQKLNITGKFFLLYYFW